MSAPGWIALWRKIREHWTWKIKPFSPGQALIDLLLRVNFSETKIPNPGKLGPSTLSPGEAIVSLRGLEADWGWSRGRVHRFLKSLKNDATIETANETTFTRVKLLNWKKYQTMPDLDGTTDETTSETTHGTTPETTYGTTNGTHQNKGTREQGKKGKKVSPPAPAPDGGPAHQGTDAGEARRLLEVAQKSTKMPNSPETLERDLLSAIARYGVNPVEDWLLDLPRNVGKDVLDLRDELKRLHPALKAAPKPKPPKCPTCLGYGRVEGDTEFRGERRSAMVTCQKCKGTGRLAAAPRPPAGKQP